MTFPNVFIVGAPKCATTALARYLEAHDRVEMMPKEVHCFGADLEIRQPGGRMGITQYRRRAEELGKNAQAVVDASVFYLQSATAAEEIFQFNPAARIIIMLRKPADMIRSVHQQERQNRDEVLPDLEQALAAEPARRRGEQIPSFAVNICGLYYRHMASYTEHVRRYLDMFPADQVKIILYDDFGADTRAVYEDTCRFIGVEPDPAANLDPVNTAATFRSAALVEFQRRVLFRFDIYRRVGRLVPKAIRAPLWKVWQGLLYKPGRTELKNPSIMQRLTADFVAEVENLERLIARDLSAWKK